jgi:hypothetical protein
MTVASALRGLPTHGDQSIAESATQELAVLFESLSAMLARSASASASMAAISAGAMASAALPSSPYKTLSSSSPTLTPYGGTVLPKLTAEHSFLTISREVEVSVATLSRSCLARLADTLFSGTPQICSADITEFQQRRTVVGRLCWCSRGPSWPQTLS